MRSKKSRGFARLPASAHNELPFRPRYTACMDEESNPYEAPVQAGRTVPARWERPALIALLLLAGPAVLATYFGLGIPPAFIVGIALNIAIRKLKRSQAEQGAPVSALPYLLFTAGWFALFLLWLRLRAQ